MSLDLSKDMFVVIAPPGPQTMRQAEAAYQVCLLRFIASTENTSKHEVHRRRLIELATYWGPFMRLMTRGDSWARQAKM